MVLLAKKGHLYWLVTDIWETFVAVPAVVEQAKWLGFSLHCTVRIAAIDTAEHADDDSLEYAVAKKMLFKNQAQARLAAEKMNERATA